MKWSTAKKHLQEQGVKFTSMAKGYALCDFDFMTATVDFYPPNATYADRQVLSCFEAYQQVGTALAAGGRLSSDSTTIVNYYALQRLFEGLKAE